MRESRDRRRGRPAVSQDRTAAPGRGEWRTLREASELTGIPIGTLRKWCRRDTVDSYLESDGELTLRMVEMGSVRAKRDKGRSKPDELREQADTRHETRESKHETQPRAPGPETMIVPVDAWNKMLNQLGNLHEAGQQLAEARERAAKAETEAQFLRERLAELRENAASSRSDSSPSGQGGPSEARDGGGQTSNEGVPRSTSDAADADRRASTTRDLQPDSPVETASFWRYVVRGWRGRRR